MRMDAEGEGAEGLALHESSPADPVEDAQEAPDPTGQDAGWWITHPDGKQVKQAVQALWKRSDSYEEKRAAKERASELRRSGVRGVQVVQDEETDTATLRFSFGAAESAKAPNRSDQLLNRVVATLTVDPPAPDVSPNSDQDTERAAARFAESVLRVEGSASKRDDVGFLRYALNLAATYSSMFALTTWHPQAGGLQPLAIEAHPQATTTDDALLITDPQTGAQMPADPTQLVTRYVRVGGSLTDSQADAQLVWQGDYCRHLLRPSQVRLVPHTAASIEDAHGALVLRVQPLAEFIAEQYDGERPDEDTVKKLVGFKPDSWRQCLPRALREGFNEDIPKRPDGTIADEAWVASLTLYFRSCATAPLGAKIVITGADEPIRDTQKVMVGAEGQQRPVILPLPLAWLRWAEDTATGDPKGISGVEQLSAHEEIRAKALGYLLSYMHRFGSPRTFVPMDSTMQDGDWQMGGDVPIRILPGAQPFFEQAPPLPSAVPQLYDAQGRELDTAAGLEAAAQGASSPEVTSGVQQQQMIEQALVALGGTQQNAHRFLCRLWRVELEYLRAFQTAPRQLQALGEGGDVQMRAFTGVDLMGAGDINIARGTGTMLPASMKQAMASEALQMALKTGDTMGALKYQRSVTGNVTPMLGLQDDPHAARIARQVQAWRDAATKQQQPAPEPSVVGVDAMGQPMLQSAPDPVAEAAARIFAPNPTDELPMVAPLRFSALSDVVASSSFANADPRYQQVLAQEYERMRQAAGVMTRAEQQQQQQQQAAQQQAMQMEQIESKNAEQAAKTAFAEKEGGPVAQSMTMRDAMQGQPQPPGL